jgi:phosphatidyl-myo-inositol dimannoside synthase
MPKILFLTLKTFSLTGGIEKVCRILTRALYDIHTKSIAVHVASMYDKNSDIDLKYITKKHFKGFSGHQIKFVLSAIIKGMRSDIVILSHINLLFVALVIKAFSPKTRVIIYAHGIEIWRPIKSWKQKFLKNKCELWSVSRYTAQKLTEFHQIPSGKIKVIPNCLDPYLEIPIVFNKSAKLLKRYNLTSQQPVLFTLTRLSSTELYKGYDLVIEILPELIKKYPLIHYLLAGKADVKEKERLQELIAKNNLSQYVTLLGFLPDEELSEHFLLADVFVMPSRKEGFGLVFIEAAACGCKVIGGNQDGTTDALLNGQLGTLVDPERKEDIPQAIIQNLEKERSNTSSLAIQSLCLEHFSYQKYLQNIQKLLLAPGVCN